MLRLFVGLDLPEDIRADLSRLCVGLPGARWMEPETFHITLRFIGDVHEGDAELIDQALAQVSAPAFLLRINSVDIFEQSRKTHSIWAGLAKEPGLLHLRDKIESAVVRTGREPERRKFKAHITLARTRDASPDRIGAFLERHNPLGLTPFSIDYFTLFRSYRGNEGAHYERLVHYQLERGATSLPPG